MNNRKSDPSPRVPQREKLKGSLQIKDLPWTDTQKKLIELSFRKDANVIFISGPAGSSKTVVSTYVALHLLSEHRVSDILYVRAAVESADSKLGFLPGSLDEKISYYGIPFLDKLEELLGRGDIQTLSKEERVKILPVNYLRGVSWNAKAIIVDESQNLLTKELITILTRIGKFTKCFVLADPEQSDINGKNGAFEQMFNLFDNEESQKQGIYTFKFEEKDIMRS